MIVSVSRRCDIPRFRFAWFMERLDAGFADTVNPFNAKQVKRVCFSGEGSPDPSFFVFWTRDPRAILERGPELVRRGFHFYTMVTLTGYPAILEPNPPPRAEVIAAMKALAGAAGPCAESGVVWRYDPILLSTVTDPEYHRRNFSALAAALEGVVNRVIISVYDDYAGARRRLAALEGGAEQGRQSFALLPHYGGGRILPELRQLLAELAAAARGHGIVPQSCAEAEDFGGLGVKPGACIDVSLVETHAGTRYPGSLSGKDGNQRPHCLCAESVDIGTYGDCPAGCVYCYARR
jgi:hypothetical protein